MTRSSANAFYLFFKGKALWILGFFGFSFFANLYTHPSNLSRLQWRLILWTPFAAVTLWVLWYALERAFFYGLRARGRGISERFALPTEVEEVWRICRTFYTQDDHVINIDSLRDFMNTNRRTAKIFFKDGKPVGLYIIFPIRIDAVRKFLDGTFSSAQSLNRLHAIKDRGKPSGLYVTNICAEGIVVRGKALESMLLDIRERIAANPCIRHIFARMANDDGGRIIRKYKFEKIQQHLSNRQVWAYHVNPSLPDCLPDSFSER